MCIFCGVLCVCVPTRPRTALGRPRASHTELRIKSITLQTETLSTDHHRRKKAKTGLLKSKLNSAIVVGAMNQDPKMRRTKSTLGGDETVYRYRLGVV